jgi:hypothetical protein
MREKTMADFIIEDEKYIQRLKNDLETANKLYREVLGHLKNSEVIVERLQKEAFASKAVIWAAANSNGGRLSVSDLSMQLSNDKKNLIHSYHDPIMAATIIEAKTETSVSKKVQ